MTGRLLCLALAGAFLAACGGGPAAAPATAPPSAGGPAAAQTAPAAAAPAAASGAPISITVMELPPVDDPTISYNTLAQDFGSFQKYGLQVDIKHAGGGGPNRIQNVVAGDADLATTDIVSMFQGIHEGADVKAIIAPGARYGSVIAASTSINAPEELKGKQVATPSLAGAARFLAGQALQTFGLQDSDIQWLAVNGTAEEIQAVTAGRVQAAVLSQTGVPAVAAAQAQGAPIHILVDTTAKYTPPWPNFVVIAKSDWIKNNPETAKRYDLAMLDMMRQVVDPKNQQVFAEYGNKMFEGLSVEDAATLWTRLNNDHYWGVNGGVNYQVDQGVMDTVFKVRNFSPNEHIGKPQDGFDTTALKAALDQLGLLSGVEDQPDWYRQ